jgi:hypothetical protein
MLRVDRAGRPEALAAGRVARDGELARPAGTSSTLQSAGAAQPHARPRERVGIAHVDELEREENPLVPMAAFRRLIERTEERRRAADRVREPSR